MTSHGPQHPAAETPVGGEAPQPERQIRWRAIWLGGVLAVLICSLTPFNNAYRQGTPLGGGHFPLAPFFILVWLTLLAAAARKIFRHRILLTGRELLVAWILMVLVSGIAYTGLARTFFINLTAPQQFATVENHWGEVLQPLLPAPLYPRSAEAVQQLYDGLPGGRQMGWGEVLRRIPWDAWIVPLLTWGGFILLCYFVMICIVNLLSGQALENERMNFPLLQVPQVIEEALDNDRIGRLLSDRFLLVGLAVPVLLHLVNGLSFYYPAVPQMPTLFLAGPYFPKYGLLSGFTKLKIFIYPAFIGFAFLTSKQISFSFWIFFIAGGLLVGVLNLLGYSIPAAALGITFGPTLSRPEETQMIGAYLVFFLFLFWLARQHFSSVLHDALRISGRETTSRNWFSTRFAFWGAVLGTLAILSWCVFFGLRLPAAILLLGAFFMVMLVATRVICQGGIAYFTLTVAPIDGLLAFWGPQFFSQVGLLIAAVTQKVLFVDLRESLMPSLLHAGRVTHQVANRRRVIGGVMITLLAGITTSLVAMLALCYKFGIRELQMDWATRTTVTVYENVYRLIETPVKPGHWVLIFAAAGAVVMFVLVVCYHRFYWWPVHPIGYLTAYSSAMQILWFSFFIGWASNALCIRYGGVVLFKKLRLFFIGLIIGDFLMGGLWALVGLFEHASYLVLPD